MFVAVVIHESSSTRCYALQISGVKLDSGKQLGVCWETVLSAAQRQVESKREGGMVHLVESSWAQSNRCSRYGIAL